MKIFHTALLTLMFAQRQWNQRSQRRHCNQSLYWLPELSSSHILKIYPKIIFKKETTEKISLSCFKKIIGNLIY